MELFFFKSNQHPGYYLVYRSRHDIDTDYWVRKLNNIGEFTNSGWEKINVSFGFGFKTASNDSFNDRFFEYLFDHVATNHIPHSHYMLTNFRAWYEFKDITNPEKWLADFTELENKEREELMKAESEGKQISLF